MPQTQCRTLTDVCKFDMLKLIDLVQKLVLARIPQILLKFEGGIEMVFDGPFILSRNNDKFLYPA